MFFLYNTTANYYYYYYYQLHTLRKRRYHFDALFIIQVYRGLKYCPSFWKLSVFEYLLGISETFLCSISAFHLKTVLLQDVHLLLMLSAGTFMYLKQILFPLVIFYNNCGTVHILDTNCIQLYKFPDLVSCLLVFVFHIFFSF
jgi:hypothetical protein